MPSMDSYSKTARELAMKIQEAIPVNKDQSQYLQLTANCSGAVSGE